MTETPTLAEKLGTTPRASRLLRKAEELGLKGAAALEALAVARGCWHYRQPDVPESPAVEESLFSNAELAIALLSPNLPYSPHTIRLGAAMLGANGNDADSLATLAKAEGCEIAVRYVARAGLQFEPDNGLWTQLLGKVAMSPEPPSGVFPHPTRFVSMTGITRAGVGRVVVWIRPRAELALAHG